MENAGTAQRELIDEQRSCIGCGYNLRMLHWSGRCPECGREVLESMGRTLFSADLDWLRGVRRGMIVLSLHMAAAMCTALVHSYGPSLVLLYVMAPAGPKTGILVELARYGSIGWVMTILALLLYGAGTWLFTRTGVTETVASSQTNTGMRLIAMVWTGLGLLFCSYAYFPRQLGDGALPIMGAMVSEALLIILFYLRLSNLAEMARAQRLASLTCWMIPLHLLALSSAITCIAVDPRIAAIILAILAVSGLILWVVYFQMLSKAMRRG